MTSPPARTEMPIERPDAMRLIFRFHLGVPTVDAAGCGWVIESWDVLLPERFWFGARPKSSRAGAADSLVAMATQAGSTKRATRAQVSLRMSRVWLSRPAASRYLPDFPNAREWSGAVVEQRGVVSEEPQLRRVDLGPGGPVDSQGQAVVRLLPSQLYCPPARPSPLLIEAAFRSSDRLVY